MDSLGDGAAAPHPRQFCGFMNVPFHFFILKSCRKFRLKADRHIVVRPPMRNCVETFSNVDATAYHFID